LHIVGILFPHINDDTRSKLHQTKTEIARASPAEWKVLLVAMDKQCSPLDSEKSGDKLSTERRSIVTTAPCETWPPVLLNLQQ